MADLCSFSVLPNFQFASIIRKGGRRRGAESPQSAEGQTSKSREWDEKGLRLLRDEFVLPFLLLFLYYFKYIKYTVFTTVW